MRAPAVSFAERFFAAFMAALLTVALVPAIAFAEGEGGTVDAPAEEPQEVSALQSDASSGVAPMLASGLVGNPTAFVSADVALDSEPVIGSFTVNGLTFAVTEGTDVELVGVSPDWQQVIGSQEGEGSPVAPMLASGPDGLAGDSSTLALPESITYEGVDYAVTSIGAYAFYLSGMTSVELPASVEQVDDRAFRSSDVASVIVADSNPTYSSFDGALYDAAQSNLLLIPEGKQGTVLLPSTAESAAPSVFSHCPLVTQIAVEEGSAAFASENGLLYDASLITLLRVPAGATDITIRDGCTTIAAGALEACASLATITAPASVTSISPDVFTSVPTVSLPAVSAVADDPGASTGATEEPSEQAGSTPASGSATTQLTAMVALSSTDDDLPEVDPSAITVSLPEDALRSCWHLFELTAPQDGHLASLDESSAYSAKAYHDLFIYHSGPLYIKQNTTGTLLATYSASTNPVKLTNIRAFAYYAQTGIIITCDQFADGWLSVSSSSVTNPSGYTVSCGSSHLASGRHGIDHCCSIYYGYTGQPPTYCELDYASVTFDAASGGGEVLDGSSYVGSFTKTSIRKQTSVYAGDAVTLPEVKPRPGWIFNGWTTQGASNLEASEYFQAGDVIRLATSTVYYAVWVPAYTIHFDGNVVDDDAHPATVPDDIGAPRDEEVELPAPTRFGYIFKGWATHPYGSTANGNQVFAPGEKAVNLTDTLGDTVTLYALWALKYDADVPICAPADMTFALDATGTGEVRAVPAGYAGDFSPSDMESMGSTHSAAIESRMAVPVEVESVSAAAIEGDGFAKVLSSTDGSAPEDQLSFTVASGDAKASVKAGQSQALSGLLVPEASDEAPVAKLALDYGLALADTAVVLANDEAAAVPVAKVSYTLDVIDGMASKWGFFMLDGGTPVTPTRIKAAADDLAEADYAGNVAASGYYEAFKDALDAASSFYLRVDDQPDGWFSVHEMSVLGICQDTLTTPRTDASGATIATKAGLTFGFKELYAYNGMTASGIRQDTYMNPTRTNSGGWEQSALRAYLRGGFLSSLDEALRSSATGIALVTKKQQYLGSSIQTTTGETVFVPSGFEAWGRTVPLTGYNQYESSSNSFQYQWFAKGGQSFAGAYLDKYWNGAKTRWWLRSATSNHADGFCFVQDRTGLDWPYDFYAYADDQSGILPCFAL